MYMCKPRRGMKRSEDSKVRNAQLRAVTHKYICAHFYLPTLYKCILVFLTRFKLHNLFIIILVCFKLFLRMEINRKF